MEAEPRPEGPDFRAASARFACWEERSLHGRITSTLQLLLTFPQLPGQASSSCFPFPPPRYPPGRAPEASCPPTAPGPPSAGAARGHTSPSAGSVSGTWALWRGRRGALTLSLWMTSSSSQKPTGPSYLSSPRRGWERCRRQGLKTAWEEWPGQGAGIHCQSEPGHQGTEETGKQRPAGKKGGRARGEGGPKINNRCWKCQTPGSWRP